MMDIQFIVRKGADCWFIDADGKAIACFDEPWFTREDVEWICHSQFGSCELDKRINK